MEGEGGADSGAPRAPPPRPSLAYEHLAFFEDTRCTLAEHEWAVKQLLYIRTLGIAHLRGFASRAPIFQMMQSLAIKRTIWRYVSRRREAGKLVGVTWRIGGVVFVIKILMTSDTFSKMELPLRSSRST